MATGNRTELYQAVLNSPALSGLTIPLELTAEQVINLLVMADQVGVTSIDHMKKHVAMTELLQQKLEAIVLRTMQSGSPGKSDKSKKGKGESPRKEE